MLRMLPCLAAALFLTSCKSGNDPAEMAKYKEQGEKLAALQKELTEIRAKNKDLESAPPAVPVEELEKKLTAAKAELQGLNDKYGELEKSHAEAVKTLEEYQEKYPLR